MKVSFQKPKKIFFDEFAFLILQIEKGLAQYKAIKLRFAFRYLVYLVAYVDKRETQGIVKFR